MDENGALRDNNQSELDEACQDLMVKNAELRQVYNYLKRENAAYKEKYSIGKEKLNSLIKLLEKNADLFQQMFSETSCALQFGRIPSLHSPTIERKEEQKLETRSTQAGPSVSFSGNVEFRETEAHANSDNFLEAAVASTSNENFEEGSLQREELTTITEEDSSVLRELKVRLDRLPSAVINSHLAQENSSSNGLGESFTSETLHPDFASTPLKLETMQSLGLMPSPKGLYSNVCVRVRRNKETERLSRNLKQEFLVPEGETSSQANKEPEPQPVQSTRPRRKATPTSFKEESLKKKKRRN